MEELFQLKKNGTNVKTEIIAGLTSFMTMAYIIALNPNLLISYSLLMLFTGKGKKVSVLTYILSLVFFIKFFLVV